MFDVFGLGILGRRPDECVTSLDITIVKVFYSTVEQRLEQYIDNEDDNDFSTVWSKPDEIFHVQKEQAKLRVVLAWLDNKIFDDEFFDWAAGAMLTEYSNKEETKKFYSDLYKENPTKEDLEISFEFYDSY